MALSWSNSPSHKHEQCQRSMEPWGMSNPICSSYRPLDCVPWRSYSNRARTTEKISLGLSPDQLPSREALPNFVEWSPQSFGQASGHRWTTLVPGIPLPHALLPSYGLQFEFRIQLSGQPCRSAVPYCLLQSFFPFFIPGWRGWFQNQTAQA